MSIIATLRCWVAAFLKVLSATTTLFFRSLLFARFVCGVRGVPSVQLVFIVKFAKKDSFEKILPVWKNNGPVILLFCHNSYPRI